MNLPPARLRPVFRSAALPVSLAFLMLIPLQARACPDFRGVYLRSDSTGQYQIRIQQEDCESVGMSILSGPYGGGIRFREFHARPTGLASPQSNQSGFDAVESAFLSDALVLLRSSVTNGPGGLILFRNTEIYRKLPDGRISVELRSLGEQLPSGIKSEQNDIQYWMRIGL